MPDFSRTRLRRKHVSLQCKYMPCSRRLRNDQTTDFCGRTVEVRGEGREGEKKGEEHGKRKDNDRSLNATFK